MVAGRGIEPGTKETSPDESLFEGDLVVTLTANNVERPPTRVSLLLTLVSIDVLPG